MEKNKYEKHYDEIYEESLDGDLKKYINSLVDSNSQNERMCLIGPSGTGKTTTLFELLFFHCRRYKRIVFCFDSVNKLVNTYTPLLRDLCNIEIDLYSPDQINEIEDKYFTEEMLNSGELLFTCFVFDDITHKITDQTLKRFLIKLFTCSRQTGADVLITLHRIRNFIKIILMNSTRILITKVNKEVEEEFGEMIINRKSLPIILNMQTGKQEYMDLSDFNTKGYSVQRLIQRLKITDNNKFPAFKLRRNDVKKNKTKFIEVKLDDGEREFQIPIPFQKLTQDYKQLMSKVKSNRDEVKKGEIFSVGIQEGSGMKAQQSCLGSDKKKNETSSNIWNLIFND